MEVILFGSMAMSLGLPIVTTCFYQCYFWDILNIHWSNFLHCWGLRTGGCHLHWGHAVENTGHIFRISNQWLPQSVLYGELSTGNWPKRDTNTLWRNPSAFVRLTINCGNEGESQVLPQKSICAICQKRKSKLDWL